MEATSVPRAAPAGVSGFGSPRLLRVASDAHLVGLIRQGRSVAFEAAYDRHHRAILSFCRHMLGSAEEAEDALQQTFLSAYNDLMASDKPIHLRAWLFTIARNRCYSILRARREQPVGELDETATEGLATQVQRRQDLRDLVVDLQRLPEDQRAALVLAEMDALSHEQIASVLGVPREKVKALVFQARESLVASRAARETDCSEIREQLANLTGGALRRGNLRRHLRECTGCREFRQQIERQRRQLRVVLPVAPTLALKETVLAATIGGGGAGAGAVAVGTAGAGAGVAAGGGGGAVATSLLKGGLMKGVLGAALAGVGTAGTLVAVQDIQTGVASRPPQLHQLVQKAPFTPASQSSGSGSGSATGTASAVAATAALRGASSPGGTRSSSTASYAALLGSTAAGATGWGSSSSGRTASGTRIAVLNPFSSHGLGATGRSPLSVPQVGSAPAVPAPPVSSGAGGGHHHGTDGTGSSDNPYLGTSAFGDGSQNAGGRGRSSGGGPQASSPSSSSSTPSYPSGSSTSSGSSISSGSSTSSTGVPNTSAGRYPTSGSTSSGTTSQHGHGASSNPGGGSDGTSSPSDSHGNGNGHAYGHTTPTGSTSSGPHATTSTPTTTPTTPVPTTSTPSPATPTTGTSNGSTHGNGWGAGGNPGSDSNSDPDANPGANDGSDHGGGTDTGPHGR